MDVIFLIGSVQALFLAIIVLNKKNKTTADYILEVWLCFLFIHLLYFYLFSSGFLFEYPHLLGIGVGFPALEPAFMYVYILTMTSKDGKFKTVYLLHTIPFIIVTLYFVVVFYPLTAGEKIAFYDQIYTDIPMHVIIWTSPNILMWPIYTVCGLIKLRQHAKNLKDNFSNTEKVSLDWLRNILTAIAIVSVAALVSSSLVGMDLLHESMDDKIIFLAMSLSVFFIGFFGIKQQAIYSRHVPNRFDQDIETNEYKINTNQFRQQSDKNLEKYKKSGLRKEDADIFEMRLLDYMDEDEPFLDPKLTLKKVSDELNISTNHLSQIINERLDMNFYDFINHYRVQRVKESIAENKIKNLTLLAIAFDSGFNSKTTFNTIFKKLTGLTPSQYIRKHT